jgi:hypothetical protein
VNDMARKPNGHDQRPEVVDLRRYRQAAAKRKPQAPPPPPNNRGRRPGQGESFIGSRKNAGLILAIAVAVLLLLTIGPGLMRLLTVLSFSQ